MILKPAELALLKRGRRTFHLPTHPGWEPGRVVRLRTSARDEGLLVTILDIVEDAGGFKVSFAPGDTRSHDVYIAAGWPDYTSDSFRAMEGEGQPIPEDAAERKSRTAWLVLALRHEPKEPKSFRPGRNGSVTQPNERVVFEAGSPEAVRVVRLFHSVSQGNEG